MRTSKATALIEICRPVNVVGAAVLAVIGAFVAGGLTTEPVATAQAGTATGLALAAGNVVNDYLDREIDAINRPERPIPRGAVEPTVALVWAIVLFLGAVVSAVWLPIEALVIAFVNVLFLITYTSLFKSLPAAGNIVVAYLVGSAFLFGAAAVNDTFAVLELAVLAGLATFAREVIKDVEDIDGDRSQGIRTLPIVIGPRPASAVGAAALFGAVLVSPLPYLTGTFEIGYLGSVLVANSIAVGAAWYTFDEPARSQRLAKLAMFVAVVSFVIGQVTVS
jgi:geranylgeranylglycerol-phosphate geranylgeranyltransferase